MTTSINNSPDKARSALHESPMNKVRVFGDDMPPDFDAAPSQSDLGDGKGNKHDMNNIFVGPNVNDMRAIEMTDLKQNGMMTGAKMMGDAYYSSPSRLKEVDNNFDPADHEFDKIEEEQVNEFPKNERPIMISWHDIEITANPVKGCCGGVPMVKETRDDGVEVEVPMPPKPIIRGVSGCAHPGDFISIIGASGAGKTTLLNHLSGRLYSPNLEISGTVKLNGQDIKEIDNYSQYSAYVQQDDLLMQTMTVEECLLFTARLKMGGTDQEMKDRVQEILTDLKLLECKDTWIGGPMFKGVSGGQRKRTSIGVELVSNPSLIFLDEPTTGLDSYTSTILMKILRNLAKSGRTIIQTIHQPNSETFELFDKLLLLSQGKIIYFNKRELAVPFFAQSGFQCPKLTNPADYFMDIMSIESLQVDIDFDESQRHESLVELENIQQQYDKRIALFDRAYASSELKNDENAVPAGITFEKLTEGKFGGDQKSWCYTMGLIASRNWMNRVRLPQTGYLGLFVTVVQSLIVDLLYWQVKGDKAGVQNRMGALFFLTLISGFGGVNSVVLTFPQERGVFLREVNNNMYSVSAYYWGKIFTELPASVFFPFVITVCVYWGVGFNMTHWSKPFIFWLTYIAQYNAFMGLGYILGTAIIDKAVASVMTPLVIVPMMLFAGFFVKQATIPSWLIFLREISIFKYAYQALFLNEFTDLEIECLSELDPKKRCNPVEEYNSPQGIWVSILLLGVIWIVCQAIAFMCLRKNARAHH